MRMLNSLAEGSVIERVETVCRLNYNFNNICATVIMLLIFAGANIFYEN